MADGNATRFALTPEGAFAALRGDTTAVAVYGALALHADRNRRARPQHATLAELLGVSTPTVSRACRRIVQAGLAACSPWLDATGRKICNEYDLSPERARVKVTGTRTSESPERASARVPRTRERSSKRGNIKPMNKKTPPTPSEAPTLGVVLPMPTGRLLDVPTSMDQVFDAWRIASHRTSTRVILTDKRKRLIRARLKEGYEIDDLIDAVRGIMRSPFHCGKNDTGAVYTDLTHALKDGEHVERFRDLERGAVRATERPTAESPSEQVARISRMINGDR